MRHNRAMRQIKLTIQYDGTRYQGWQSQKTGITLQDTIAGSIRVITNEYVTLLGASRTDAGVHALGQVAAFCTNSGLSVDVLKRALNAKLPADIRIHLLEETDGAFHPRFDALKKRYIYFLSLDRCRSAFFYKYSWHIPGVFNLKAMQEASSLIKGTHDFSSFRASGCGARTTVRTISAISVEALEALDFMNFRIKGDFMKITVEADAFLRHMVRNIVGTLVEIGRGRKTVDGMSSILNAKDRTKAGPTSPAAGLFLEKIYY